MRILFVLEEIVTTNDEKNTCSIYLVFEYMDHDLAGLINNVMNEDWFKPAEVKCLIKQLLEAVYYLHRNNILHRDIKASNLLLNNHGILKLADFGLARPICELTHRNGKYTNNVITRWYRPPEILMGEEEYGQEVDMWSVGCIFAELLNKKPLLPGGDDSQQIELIWELVGTPTNETWPDFEKLPLYQSFKPKKNYKCSIEEKFSNDPQWSRYSISFLKDLLNLDPKKRIDAAVSLDSEYFSEDPQICNPESIRTFSFSSHEYTTKKRRAPNTMMNNPKRPKIQRRDRENNIPLEGRDTENWQSNGENNQRAPPPRRRPPINKDINEGERKPSRNHQTRYPRKSRN